MAMLLANYALVLRKLDRKTEAGAAEKRAETILAKHSSDNLLDARIDFSDLLSFRDRRQ